MDRHPAHVTASATALALGLCLSPSLGCPKDQSGARKTSTKPTTEVAEAVGQAEGEKTPRGEAQKKMAAVARARTIAQRVIIADGHVDLPYRLHEGRGEDGNLTEDVSKLTKKGDFDFERARTGGLDVPFMSIYTPSRLEKYPKKDKPTFDGSKKLADELIDLVEGLAKQHPTKFRVITSVAEVRKAKADKVIAFPLGMENGSPLEGKLENLEHFHRRGIRYITLAHAEDNHLADSSYDDRHTNQGLTDFGKKVVGRMNELGIMIDISHLSDQAAVASIETSAAPVIASHSSCRHFTPGWERNISDELIQKTAAKGGVVLVNFGSTFIDHELRKKSSARWKAWEKMASLKKFASEKAKKAARRLFFKKEKLGYSTVERVADHIEHVIKLVGVDHVGFGSDFDGVGDSLPEGLKDVSQYPNLIRVLMDRGYSEEDIEKIAGGNFLRVWKAVEDHAKASAK